MRRVKLLDVVQGLEMEGQNIEVYDITPKKVSSHIKSLETNDIRKGLMNPSKLFAGRINFQ